MRPLHFIADDFGLSSEVNAAILRAHREGALTGASLMAGQPGTAEALDLARATPSLDVGWHLHLCDSRPLTLPDWPWGDSPALAGFCLVTSRFPRAKLRRELAAQWEVFRESGQRCAFINSHHHLHLHPLVLGVVREVVDRDFDGWLRGPEYRLFRPTNLTARVTRLAGRLLAGTLRNRWPVARSAEIWGVDRLHSMNAAEIANIVTGPGTGPREFIFHPRAMAGDADLTCLLQLRGSFPPARNG